MTPRKLGGLALLISSLVLFILPAGSLGSAQSLREAREALEKAGQQLQAGLESTLQKTGEGTAAVVDKTKASLKKATATKQRATTTNPETEPPLHGANPHGQGSVAVVDLNPSNERPLDADTTGKLSGEDVVVGRARGEQNADGTYHGHITIAALFGNEIAGVDSKPGETKNGPLAGLQTGVLDPLCNSTGGQVCLAVLTANTSTTATGSTNEFSTASAKLLGLGVGAAESRGNITQDANCQTSGGEAKTANVTSSGAVTAAAANSASVSRSCRGQAPQVSNTSTVVQLGAAGLPLPAPGCADGTPDTVAGLPPLLPIICNAEEIAGAAAVREALDVYVLAGVGGTSLTKETTAASESVSVAPPEAAGTPQCSDGVDNDGDGVADSADPGCHTDNDATNPASYDAADNDERDARNTGSGDDDDGGDGPQCSDERDNDGDGLVDSRDPGCHTDGNPNNPDSFDPDDDSEGGDGGGGGGDGAASLDSGSLPFTGTDVIGMSLAGMLALAGGLLLRRREDTRTVR